MDHPTSPSSRHATLPGLPTDATGVREVVRERDGATWHAHPDWDQAFPWLVQGTTARPTGDMALFGRSRAGEVQGRWLHLLEVLGMQEAVHGRQVHGAVVRVHRDGGEGLRVLPGTDGHVTRTRGLLLTVATADCIPVTVVDPVRRSVALLHAGWRGVVAGILETGFAVMGERLASRPPDLHVHLGPAICGSCYEVGPEVHEALGLPAPSGPTPVDLRAVAARRVVQAGVPADRITVSALCTRCDGDVLYSHRGGCGERQVGFAGVLG